MVCLCLKYWRVAPIGWSGYPEFVIMTTGQGSKSVDQPGQIFVGVVASNVQEVIAGRYVEKPEVLGVVGKENGGNFVNWDVEEVGDVLGSGNGVAEDVLGLGENLGNIVAAINRQGRTASGKPQGDEVVDGDDVAAVGKQGGFRKWGKQEGRSRSPAAYSRSQFLVDSRQL